MVNVLAKGTINTLINRNDKGIMSTQLSIEEVLEIYTINHEVNRDLGYHRLPKIVKYLDSIDSSVGIFFPSIVLSYRGDPTNFYEVSTSTLEIVKDNKLVVIDGQHRIKGIEQYLNKVSISSEAKEKLIKSNLTVQIYFGLTLEEEKKLFTDINTNAKRVSRSLVTNYDTRDIYNLLVRELYHSSDALKNATVEFNKSRIVRPTNTTFITSVRLKKFINLMIFGKESPNQKNEAQIKEQYDEIFSFLNKFFSIFFRSLPAVPGDVLKHVLGHEPIQNAIALYINDAIIVENDNKIKWLETWEDEVEQLKLINWSVKNRDWLPYMMDSRKNSPYQYKSFIETTTLDLKEIIEKKLL
ncbi:DNA sulfur modification protein DndB [Planococcus halocryophilus]|uniref:DNA sulfur modification protein DndB n=1 Tax=Planococcus halocryophilus TaxID=1215089 RepID=UPI001F1184AA|nr:DNA sulfur modification protein DndB [Planococcus halocryophilus]MCH4825550.1 DGQHR domain-containing protein [Planococcus halocryophilus]